MDFDWSRLALLIVVGWTDRQTDRPAHGSDRICMEKRGGKGGNVDCDFAFSFASFFLFFFL